MHGTWNILKYNSHFSSNKELTVVLADECLLSKNLEFGIIFLSVVWNLFLLVTQNVTQTKNKSAAVFYVSISFHEKLLTSLSRFRVLFLRTQRLLI